MFIGSRYVLVDDNPKHLKGIKLALNELRLDCHTKLYVEEEVGDWEVLPGTRVLFLDMNLVGGDTTGSGASATFTNMAEVIEKLICPNSGPYGIIIWAKDPQVEALKEFLFERFDGDQKRLLPVFFSQLQKDHYINTINGNPLEGTNLSQDIINMMSSSPQMKALLSWEADVALAADAVLRSIVDLVDPEKRATDGFGGELGEALYRLSQAGSGMDRAEENPRDSINRVLVPILADRVTEHDPQGDAQESWKDAIIAPANSKNPVPVPVQASVNSAMHLSFARTPASAPIHPAELGAVVELPIDDTDEFLRYNFGFDQSVFLKDVFLITEEEWKDCTPRLVQIGAACDAAQPKPGPLLYLFAVEWPFANANGLKDRGIKGGDPKKNLSADDKGRKPKELEWQSPILKIGDAPQGGRVSVFKNLSIGLPPDKAEELKACYRFREELISQLTQDYARYVSRPGIVSL